LTLTGFRVVIARTCWAQDQDPVL